MKNNFKRILSMILVVVTVVGCCAFPVSATAPVAQSTCDHTIKEPGDAWELESTIESTCNQQGYELWYCTKCLLYKQENVKGTGEHQWEKMTKEKKPTCDADGYPAGSVICNKCGIYNPDPEINPALPQKYKKLTTCTDPKCVGGEHNVGSSKCIHNFGDPEHDGDACLDKTALKYTCLDCGEVYNTTGNGHAWVYSELKEPTCHLGTKADPDKGCGSVKRTCSICGDVQIVKIDRITTHEWVADKTAKTKADDDYCGKICAVCGAQEKDTQAHDYKVVKDQKADCLVGKDLQKVCKLCDYEYKETGDPLGHQESTALGVVTPEVHNKEEQTPAVIKFHCDRCNTDWTRNEKDDVEHPVRKGTYVEIPATCVEPGFETWRCDVCELIIKNDIPVAGHDKPVSDLTKAECNLSAKQPEFDCEEGGYYSYYCSVCKEDWVDKSTEIKAGTHKWATTQTVELPKCGVAGFTGYDCTMCDARDGEITYIEGQKEHNIVTKPLFTYGNGCTEWKYEFTYCKNSGCDYNAKAAYDALVAAKKDSAEIFAELKDLYDNKKIFMDPFKPKGGHKVTTEKTIIKADCMNDGWKGSVCDDCGATFLTEPVSLQNFEDYHNHVDGKQTLLVFRWACGATTGEQLYSTYKCQDCGRTYTTRSFIPKNGLELEVGVNVETEILIYVGGAPTSVNKLSVTKDSIKNATFNEYDELVSGSEHVFNYEEGNEPKCNVAGTLTCAICDVTKTGVTVDCEARPKGDAKYSETLGKNPCADVGTWKSECKWCGKEMTGEVPATGKHTYDQKVTCAIEGHDCKDITKCTYYKALPTCIADATYYMSCKCGASAKDAKAAADKKKTFTVDDTMLPHVYDQKFACNKKDCDHADSKNCEYKNAAGTVVVYKASENKDCQTVAKYYYACVCGETSKGTKDEKTYDFGPEGQCPENIVPATPVTGFVECLNYSYVKSDTCALCDTQHVWYGFVAAKGHVAKDYTGMQDPFNTKLNTPNPVPAAGEKPYKAPTCTELGYWYAECMYCNEYADKNGTLFFPDEQQINDGTVKKDDKNYYDASKNDPHYNIAGVILTGNCKYNVPEISGANEYKCAYCKEEIKPQHDYVEDGTECGDEVCSICQDKKEMPYKDHDYVKSDELTTEEGVIVEVCTVCGKIHETIIPAVTFSMDIANPNGSVIVNGGKAYLTINMDCVNATMHSVYLELTAPAYLTGAKKVENGALGGNVEVNQVGTAVSVFADVGTERENVTLKGDELLCVIEFTVDYNAWIGASSSIENNVKKTEISFVEPAVDEKKIMVLNYAGEKVAFDVKENKTLKFNIDQIGDINNDGVINSEDARLLAIAINTKAEYNAVYDVNNDGAVNVLDYGRMMKYIVGIINYDNLVKNTDPTV